jgi:hypothetical protein
MDLSTVARLPAGEKPATLFVALELSKVWTCSTVDREADPDIVCKRSRRCAQLLTLHASYEAVIGNY